MYIFASPGLASCLSRPLSSNVRPHESPPPVKRALRHLMLLAATLFLLAGCSSHAFHEQALQYQAEAVSVLVSSGQCSDGNDCQSKQLVLFEAGGGSLGPFRWGGVTINMYGQTEKAAYSAVLHALTGKHRSLGGPSVHLVAHTSSHGQPKAVLAETTIP